MEERPYLSNRSPGIKFFLHYVRLTPSFAIKPGIAIEEDTQQIVFIMSVYKSSIVCGVVRAISGRIQPCAGRIQPCAGRMQPC